MKNIMIWGYTNFKWLLVPLAQELKRRHSTKTHFVCTDEQSVRYWKKQDPEKVIDSFTTTGHFFFAYDEVEDSAEIVFRRAREYEQKYKILFVDILQTDRHLGRGFFSGGIGHPKSKLSEKASYLKSINFCNRAFEFWERFFNEKNPDLILGVTASVLGKTCTTVAHARNIPIRELFRVGYQAYHGWTADEYYIIVGLVQAFQKLANTDPKMLVSDEELTGIKRVPLTDQYYKNFRKCTSWWQIVKGAGRQVVWYVLKYYRGRQTVGEYIFLEKIRALYRMRKDLKQIMKLKLVEVKDLEHKSFVLIPLHVEPESSVGMQSPEMNEQLAAIEFIAKNLPAGTQLVVKEHIAAVGRRPRDFYETILAIPNVLMLSPFAYALEAGRRARAVAVITSTLGMEAAVLGVPVISFGLHNNYNILPHVYTVESWTALRPLLARLCAENMDEGAKQRTEDGRRYLAALKQVCFDFSWADYMSKDRASANTREVQVVCDSLMESLKH